MAEIQYISLEEIIYLHELLIAEFGGSPGLRDKGLLDSAIHRPQSGYYESLHEQAAALMQSIALNHAFVDGNKRVAIAAPLTFLRINGIKIVCSADEGEKFLIDGVIRRKISTAEIADWLKAHSK